MKVAAQIREKIKEIPESEPFGYAQLGISPGNFFTAAKALERLQKKGVIKKVSKGIFFKPQKTRSFITFALLLHGAPSHIAPSN